MSNEIGQLLNEAFADVGALPPETAVHARARRHQRNNRLFGASGAVVAVLLVAGLLTTRGTPNAQVSTKGPASATPSVEDPGDEAGSDEVGPTSDSGQASATAQRPMPVSGVATTVPPVTLPTRTTLPGQSAPVQHVFTAPPSGTRVYFLSGGNLVSTRLDGTDRVVVLSGYLGRPIGVFPGGTKLLMHTTRDGGSSIVVLDLRTGDRTTVVHRDRNDIGYVDLSPDGTRIAYSAANYRMQSLVTGYTSPSDVHIVDADGSGDRVLVRGSAPFWAPDGSRLLVQGCEDNSGRPCTIKPDGSGMKVLYGFPYTGKVSWSPDGAWIAGSDSNGRLSIARLDGSQLRTVGKLMGPSRPAWTPDGSRIVYQRLPEGQNLHTGECGSGCDGTYGISSAAVDGSGEFQLTTAQNDGSLVIG
jgi:hypothetical protein